MFGYYAGGGRLERTADVPDTVAFEGAMGSIVVDGKPITFRGLAPEVNYYDVRSAALVGARLHVLAESSLRGLTYDVRTHALSGTTVAAEPGTLGVPANTLRVFPNPTHGSVTFQLTLTQPQPVRIEILDVLGRRAVLLAETAPPSDGRALTLDTRALPSGTYTVRVLGSGGLVLTQSLTVIR